MKIPIALLAMAMAPAFAQTLVDPVKPADQATDAAAGTPAPAG